MMSNFIRGKGIWKFNTTLLVVEREVKKYAVPLSNRQILKEMPVSDINLPITDDLFLEVILHRIRGETVKYSSKQRRLKISKKRYC